MLIPLVAKVQTLVLNGRLTELSEEKPLTCDHTFKRVSEFFSLLKKFREHRGLKKRHNGSPALLPKHDSGF